MEHHWLGYMFSNQREQDDETVYITSDMQRIGQNFAPHDVRQSQTLGSMIEAQDMSFLQGPPTNSRGTTSSIHSPFSGYPAQHATYPTYTLTHSTSSGSHTQSPARLNHLYQPPQYVNPSFPMLHGAAVPRSHPAWGQRLSDPIMSQSLGTTPHSGSHGDHEQPLFFNQNVPHMPNINPNAMQGAYTTQRPPSNAAHIGFTLISGHNRGGHGNFSPLTRPYVEVPPESGAIERSMPMPASSTPTDRSSSESAGMAIQTFTCEIDDCGSVLPVDKVFYASHLFAAHEYGSVKRGRAVECRWSDCTCTRQNQCRGRSAGHGWHGENVLEHIWETHLAFQDPCPQCGDVRWQHQFSKERHAKNCTGRKPARCRGCLMLFGSHVALGGHIELRQCAGYSATVVG